MDLTLALWLLAFSLLQFSPVLVLKSRSVFIVRLCCYSGVALNAGILNFDCRCRSRISRNRLPFEGLAPLRRKPVPPSLVLKSIIICWYSVAHCCECCSGRQARLNSPDSTTIWFLDSIACGRVHYLHCSLRTTSSMWAPQRMAASERRAKCSHSKAPPQYLYARTLVCTVCARLVSMRIIISISCLKRVIFCVIN